MGRKDSISSVTGAPPSALLIPPALDSIRGDLEACDVDQRDALIRAFEACQISMEEAGKQAKQIATSTFSGKLLGSVPVAAARLSATMWKIFGSEVISTASPRLKVLKRKPVAVHVTISNTTGCRVVEEKTGVVLEDEPFWSVVYAAVDAADSKRVGIITQYPKLGLLYCHVFQLKSAAAANAAADIVASKIQDAQQQEQRPEVEADRHEKATGGTIAIFEVRSLGIVSVDHIKSRRECVRHSVAILQERIRLNKGKEEATPVVVVITAEAFRAVELGSREVLSNAVIENVAYYTGVDAKKQGLFCVVLKDSRLNRKTCHVFCCKTGEGKQICTKMSEAKQQHQQDSEARSNNPFMPFSSHGDVVSGILADKQISRKELKYLKPLGAGQFGEVALAEQTTADGARQRAVKTLRGGASYTDKEAFMREFEMMADLQHPNLVNLVGVCAAQRPWLGVLEFVQYGDLSNLLKACRENDVKMTLNEQLKLAVDIATGLEYVSFKRLVHLDVAARNCLIDHNNRAKIADFGLARRFEEGKDYAVLKEKIPLSIRWLCVEVMGPPPKCLSEKSDVWSFGVTVWEIFSYGQRPYRKLQLKEVQHFVYRGARLTQPSDCPDDCFAVLRTCWERDPAKRPSFTEVKSQLKKMMRAGVETRDIGALLHQQATEDASEEPLTEELQLEGTDALMKGYAYPD